MGGVQQHPKLNPTEQLLDELKHRLHGRPPHLTSVSDLTNVHAAELAEIRADKLQNLMEAFPEKYRLL